MTKKLLALMVAVLMVAGLMAPLSALASVYVSTPNGGGLNLREAPDSSSRVLLVIPYGDEFYVFDNLGNGWVYGHWGGEFGYVQSRYLSNTRPGPVSTVTRAPSPSATTNPEDENSAEEAKLRNEINSEKDVSPFYVEVRTPRSTSWVYKDAVFDTNEYPGHRRAEAGNIKKSRAFAVPPVIPAEL